MHLIHRLDVGGLENGLVNVINNMDSAKFNHAIIAVTEITSFSNRIKREDVELIALNHPGGQTSKQFPKLFRILRQLQPSVFHTRNLATLEFQLVASTRRKLFRIHGEHGWDMNNLNGENLNHLRLRKIMRRFTDLQIALSTHTAQYLLDQVGVSKNRLRKICNGVDVDKFKPQLPKPAEWDQKINPGDFVIGTVGRLTAVKNQALLIRAFAQLLQSLDVRAGKELKLVLVGDGPLEIELSHLARDLKISDHVWFAGQRNDIPQFMSSMDVFVLPSHSEGISNSILEAMAAGAVLVATAVGGNPELIEPGQGFLFTDNSQDELVKILTDLYGARLENNQFRAYNRQVAIEKYSLRTMVDNYQRCYEEAIKS